MSKAVYCNNCHEFIYPKEPTECLPLKDGSMKIKD
jgi:hypothetical protein